MYKTTTDLVKAIARRNPARAFGISIKIQGGYIHAAVVSDNVAREMRNWDQALHWSTVAGDAQRRMRAVNR